MASQQFVIYRNQEKMSKKIVKYLFSLPSVVSSMADISGKSDLLPDDVTGFARVNI